MKSSFKEFINSLSETNETLKGLTDFKKVKQNVAQISLKLHQLNYLIGKTNLREAIKELYNENPKSFEVLNILLAVRTKGKKKVINSKGKFVLLESYFTSLNGVIEYIEQTGIAEILSNKNVTNLVDYVFGVEVGLDTNARKNRSGKNMAHIVSQRFSDAKIPFEEEVNSKTYPDLNSFDTDLKRFDFAIKTRKKIYLIETNFYNVGGSKLNEVARAYSNISQKINKNKNYSFVWITDGQGWLEAKNKLEEAYSNIPHVYNLSNLDKFLRLVKSEL